jgi:hypothetical protein
MEGFLTTVITDVDAYWTETLGRAGLPEPEVRYRWLPEGSTVRTACSDATGQALQVTDRHRRVPPGRRHDLHLEALRRGHLRRLTARGVQAVACRSSSTSASSPNSTPRARTITGHDDSVATRRETPPSSTARLGP